MPWEAVSGSQGHPSRLWHGLPLYSSFLADVDVKRSWKVARVWGHVKKEKSWVMRILFKGERFRGGIFHIFSHENRHFLEDFFVLLSHSEPFWF